MQRLPVGQPRYWRSWFWCGMSGGLAVLLWLAGGVLMAHAVATPLCVNPTGAGGCFTTIQAAVNAAVSGDTINIAAGTYSPVSVSAKNLSFVGAGRDQTFIDGGGISRAVATASNAKIGLSNLTVQNGYSAAGYGAGIYAVSALTLTNVNVLSNTAVASYYGGGVFAGGTLLINNARFISNTASVGGGVYAFSTAYVTNSRFEHNTAVGGDANGGGLFVLGGTLTVTGTDFISNSAKGGAGAVSNVSVVMTDVTFEDNYAEQFAGLGAVGTAAVLRNTNFFSNTSTGSASGGAYLLGNVQITGGRYIGNTCGAGCSGGGLNVKAGTISGTLFISNTSAGGGGGLTVSGTAATTALTVTNAYFERNICTDSGCMGGGMYADARVALVDTDFYSNTGGMSNYGGGRAACHPGCHNFRRYIPEQ